jgi:putative FmdB family regulatory protein
MPLYEYECGACGHRFETIQKFSDPPLEQCPKCGGQVRKLQSAPAFQFKGSGWYITDYARKDSGSAGGESKGDASGDGKKAETKAETKTDAKTDTKTDTKSDAAAAASDAKPKPTSTKPTS